jgi:hypothetical protein
MNWGQMAEGVVGGGTINIKTRKRLAIITILEHNKNETEKSIAVSI